MAPASEAKRPRRTYDVRSFLDPLSNLEVLSSFKTSDDDGVGAICVAGYVFGARSQGPPGQEVAL